MPSMDPRLERPPYTARLASANRAPPAAPWTTDLSRCDKSLAFLAGSSASQCSEEYCCSSFPAPGCAL